VTGSLEESLAVQRADEVLRAARALLGSPLLSARGRDADAFRQVRQHAAELRTWFERNTGWQLLVDSEVARLRKQAGGDNDATHPAVDSRGTPFSRRRYVLACLALAVMERGDQQIALGRLAEQVVMAAADPQLVSAGLVFTLEDREQRTDLVAVVRMLLGLGVLVKVAGDEDAFLKSAGDVLYDVDKRVLSGLLACRRGPSTVAAEDFEARLTGLNAEVVPDTEELRNRALRHRLTRRLLDDPVMYYDELTEAETSYLASQRGQITRRISELTGLVAEVRAEGVAMVDPFDNLTDLRMPESGTDGHVTLLVAEYLAGRGGTVPLRDLHRLVRGLALQHAGFWRRSATEPGAELALTDGALDRLEALGLVVRIHQGADAPAVRGRPALDRYRVGETVMLERGEQAPRRSGPRTAARKKPSPDVASKGSSSLSASRGKGAQ
jgi:uncharacterized protein (TIGR02678 family)